MYSLMKNLFRKLNRWYSGYIDIQNRVDDKENLVSTVIIYPQSIIKRFILFVRVFWSIHWQWSIRTFLITIGTLATIGIFIVMLLEYLKSID